MRTTEQAERPDDLLKISRPRLLAVRAKNLMPQPHELARPVRYVRNTKFVRRLTDEEYTMLGAYRARNLLELARTVNESGINGAIVDCGVWNGGSTILLGLGAPRHEIWAFDSFAGLPSPGERDPDAHEDWTGELVGSDDKLREGFAKYAGNLDRLHVVKGWFEDTLASAAQEIDQIAILAIDADWYESVRLALDVFYDKVVSGGFVAIDDLRMWQGAREATAEFRERRGIASPIRSSHYWRKD